MSIMEKILQLRMLESSVSTVVKAGDWSPLGAQISEFWSATSCGSIGVESLKTIANAIMWKLMSHGTLEKGAMKLEHPKPFRLNP